MKECKWVMRRAQQVGASKCQWGLLLCALILTSVCALAQTTTTRTLMPATTATLRATADFFPVVLQERATTLPLVSLVEGESSAALGLVTAFELRTTRTVAGEIGKVEVTTSTEALIAEKAGIRLPVKVDKSSTEATVRQLIHFEKQNQYAEAFLLACELVRENPTSEFAYDAAIRTALVLAGGSPTHMEQDIERFFRQAMRIAALPGRYYVQLAHYYERTGKVEKLRKLVEEYEKNNVKDPDYWVTLARIHAMSGDLNRTRLFIERASQRKVVEFPLTLLGARTYRQLGLADKAREMLLRAVDEDYGPWEMQALFLEFLQLPGNKPEALGKMVLAAMVNEARYRVARGLADTLIRTMVEQRTFFDLQDWLAKRVAEKTAADVEVWLLALMYAQEGDEPRALELLLQERTRTTPVIAFERAKALAAAGRHSEAIPILSILLAEQPNDVAIRLLLAQQQIAAGQAKECLATLTPLRWEKLSRDDRLRAAEAAVAALVKLGNTPRLIELWLDLTRSTTFVELQRLADIVLQAVQGSPVAEELKTRLSSLIQEHGQWPLLWLYARLVGREGDHKSEMQYYSRYVEHVGDDTELLRFVAHLSIEYATLPLKIEATRDRTTSAAIRVLDASYSDLAIDLYKRLIALQPMVAENYAALMRIYQMRGEVEAAKKVAAEVAQRDPDSPKTLAIAASILDENGFIPEALHFYERSLRADPTNFAVWMKYAEALRAAGQRTEAEIIYKKILEEGYNSRPYNQPAILAALYRIALETNRTQELVNYLYGLRTRSIPGKPEFLLSTSKLFIQLREFDKAGELISQFQKEFPTSNLLEESFLLRGQVWFSRGDIPRAIEAYREAATRFAGSPTAISAGFNIAVAYAHAGKIQDALAAFEDLARRHPTDDKAQSALYEAAVLSWRFYGDSQRCARYLERYLAARTLDFALRKTVRDALKRIQAGQPPFGEVAAQARDSQTTSGR